MREEATNQCKKTEGASNQGKKEKESQTRQSLEKLHKDLLSSSEEEKGEEDGSEFAEDSPPVEHVPSKTLFWSGTEPSVPHVLSVPLNLGKL